MVAESVRHLQTCAQLLMEPKDVAFITEIIAKQIRCIFDAAQVAVILETAGQLELAGFAGDYGTLQSHLCRQLSSGTGFFVDLFRKTLADGNPILQGFEESTDTRYDTFESIYCIPLRIGDCWVLFSLFLSVDQQLDGNEVTFLQALAQIAAMALSNVKLPTTNYGGSARKVEISEQHRSRAEALVSFALDLGTSVELEELVRKFTSRAMELLEARASFMALVRGGRAHTVFLHGIANDRQRADINDRLTVALGALIEKTPTKWAALSGEKLDPHLAAEFAWRQIIVLPLFGSGDELLALVGLVDCRRHSSSDVELVQAMSTHAAAALQNSQLFTRITRSSRQWAEIFDSISDLMLLHDEHQRILRVNRSLSEKLNTQPAELLGSLVRDLFGLSPDTAACPFCVDLSGKEFREEFRESKTGNTYLVSSSRLRGIREDSQQVVHVLKDVTASRRAERLYRELFDNIQEGAYFCGADGRLLEVNDALVRMLGYNSREELLAVKAHDLYVDPSHREITTRALNQFGRLRNHELALLRRDRSIIYVLENSFVVRDETGKVLEYRGVLLDITEIKNVQSQLLREHDFNTQILNHTQSLIAVVDTAGLVSYANRRCCEVAGSDCELVGSRLETIVLPSHRGVLRSALECALEGKGVNNLELALSRGREVIGSFSVNLSPMRSPRGEVNSLVAVMTDITDVAMLQAKLMHAEKMAAVGQLVSGVAHEVNNPLTAILGFADLLLENPELSGEAKEDLQIIVQETQRTREIVQNLLSFARQTRPEKQAVDINQVLRRTVLLRAYDMGSHGIELREEFDPELPEVIADAHQLQQVFLNVLNNACDAVREAGRRGRIVIATEKLRDCVEVRFRDNGTGISNPDRLFDPFYTTKEVGKGTGLGLSICYGIVREHNGEIACFNNQVSEGATFAIRLPLSIAEPASNREKAAAAR
jgi:two-component system NtrC family sensor kinase